MGFKLNQKIAFKQARAVLVIAVVLGLVSNAFQIYLDLVQEKKSATTSIQQVISLHRETAERSVYLLDERQAKKVTETLIEHPAIFEARLLDDFGDSLAYSYRDPDSSPSVTSEIAGILFKVERYIDIPLTLNDKANIPARLMLSIDVPYIAGNFVNRALNSLLIGLAHGVVLAVVLLLLFYRYLSRPITKIVNWVHQLGSDVPNEQLPYSEKDELGELVHSFSALWQKNLETADQLNASVSDLKRSEHFSRSLMENAGDAMFLCLPDTSIVRVNKLASDTLQIPKERLIGKKLSSFSEHQSQEQYLEIFAGIEEHQVSTFEDSQVDSCGGSFPVEARGIKVYLQDQAYLLILARDITQRRQDEKQIYELAFFDTLTNLPNRRLFMDRLKSSIGLHKANHSYGAVLYMDLDRFKTINDSLGHAVGDNLLQEVGQRFENVLPQEATCSRFGGDEFVILLPESGPSLKVCAEHAAHLAEEILERMQVPFEVEGHVLYCTASIGITVFPDDSCTVLDILRQADTALYRVKALGRNGFQFYDSEMQSSAKQRLQVEKGLHQAIDNNEFDLWYQPQIDAKGHMIGAEALLRWTHPIKGMVYPAEFIQVAEDSGQIIEIGEWVIRKGLADLAIWIERGIPETFLRLSINISPAQFMQVNFVDQVISLLESFQVPGYMLELEITENMLLNNFEIASHKMKLLKQKGVHFAIDDFGTGYSSLKYLQHLPLDVLKIDRSFVTKVKTGSEQAAIVEVIIAMADRLDLVVIAEGVENKEEMESLRDLGCFCYQGFLYSKAVPAVSLFNMIDKNYSPAAKPISPKSS